MDAFDLITVTEQDAIKMLSFHSGIITIHHTDTTHVLRVVMR